MYIKISKCNSLIKTLVKSKVIVQQQNTIARQTKTNILRQSRREINENWNTGWTHTIWMDQHKIGMDR